jgi:hypothetical protein
MRSYFDKRHARTLDFVVKRQFYVVSKNFLIFYSLKSIIT